MHLCDILAVTPAATSDPAVAIAATRAGACGIIDLEFAIPDALELVHRVARFTAAPFGVKLGPASGELLNVLLPQRPAALRRVVLAGGEFPQAAEWVTRLQAHGLEVLWEAISIAEATLGVQLGVDGLILKGHEAGGRIGDETTFILLQRWRTTQQSVLPVWAHGGIGLHTLAACLVADVRGVVLDAQLLLTREAGLGEAARQRLQGFDGSETVCIGEQLGSAYRCYSRPGWPAAEEAAREEQRLATVALDASEKQLAWRQTVTRLVRGGTEQSLWLVGQDAALARPLAERFGTVAGIIQGLLANAELQLQSARRLHPLAEKSTLAQHHRTRYPIVQGPMTRVSDTAPFAAAVAEAGGLPFLALALLRQAETETLLKETQALLGERSWGVGILGFVPPEIRNEQLAAIRTYKPPFALIAGGRPDQARELEKEGITTYLHVPSTGLLRMFLRDGARRFVFEGRECGGHVGPRTSFVLWEAMCQALLEHLGPTGKGTDLHVLFAGGVHDALSSAMVAALSVPLAERGVAVGVLMGTAYLFTQEAVTGGAIVPRFQQEAVECDHTVLLQTGPGHAIRCIETPYYLHFDAEKRRLQSEGRTHEEIVKALEWMNIGRLRVASKGVDRAAEGAPARLVALSEAEQIQRGMYMIGQVASMRSGLVTMAALHHDVCSGGSQLLGAPTPRTVVNDEYPEKPCDVAIIGMSCFYPQASNVATYWQNILDKVNAVVEVPADHWDWRLYYDADSRARDKIISRWGGFLEDTAFDPLVYGITPNSLYSIEPLQLYILETVRTALTDSGYLTRPFDRERTAAILGIGGGGSPVAVSYGFRTCIPMLDTVPGLTMTSDEVMDKVRPLLPEWTEDSFPGMLQNVAVGRVANRFNLGGPNYAVDAACGSSLAALQACIRELEIGTSDLAIAIGADTVQTPYAYMAFSKTHALSPRGRCRPFDASADGIALAEGVGAVILKRLADAERDGDRIYAVIKGVGASSDGKDKGLTAPRPEGQLRALRRAYGHARVSPSRVELVEAHGTGTVVGDQTEAGSLAAVFQQAGADAQSCVLGSVKSMIGHSKCAAGIAGLIKTTLALYHKILPPTLVEQPNPKGNFERGPFFLNTEARPWVHGRDYPRTAGVSAFGFGGTNFHTVLEEYTGSYLDERDNPVPRWPAELLVWRRADRATLTQAVEQAHAALTKGAKPDLAVLAAILWKSRTLGTGQPTLSVVASGHDDLREKLQAALETLKKEVGVWSDPRGIYLNLQPEESAQTVAFLFPGQGSQYPDMLAQQAMVFPELRATLDRAEQVLLNDLERPLGKYIYPRSTFTPDAAKQVQDELTRADVAQPALGAVSLGMFQVLTTLGVEPAFLAGHSYGEYVALCAAGAMDAETLIRLSHQRGRILREQSGQVAGGMAAIEADAATTAQLAAAVNGVSLANANAPTQTVVAGSLDAIEAMLAHCKTHNVRAQKINVACAYHSPLIEPARQPLLAALSEAQFHPLQRSVYSNTTAAPYAGGALPEQLANHLVAPVKFAAEIEALYQAGARLFVEVGPQQVLTGLVQQILKGRPHLALASDVKRRPGLIQLAHLLGQLLVHGVPVQLERLFVGRHLPVSDLTTLLQDTGVPKHSPTSWIINSVRNRPLNGPEPLLIGKTRLRGGEVQTPPAELKKPEPARVPAAPRPEPAKPQPRIPVPMATPQSSNGIPTVPVASSDEATQVMLKFQDLMARFLDTQKSVMASYLQGGTAPAPMPTVAPYPVTVNGNGHGNGHSHGNGNGHTLVPPPRPAVTPPPAAVPPPAPAPVAETPVAPVKAAKPALDRAWLSNQLLELISTRTGYPRDMLGLDLDLEADLGIDSIKRVEILGELAQAMGADDSDSDLAGRIEMEKLTSIKTLRGILDYLVSIVEKPEGKSTATPATPTDAPVAVPQGIQRALLRLVDAPLPRMTALTLVRGAIVFTDDGRGVAREMANRLADFGQRTVLIRATPSGDKEAPKQSAEGIYTADVTNPAQVTAVLERIRADVGAISGLVHLLPLAHQEPSLAAVQALYLLTRGLGEDLRTSAAQGSALLIAATSFGGAFGIGESPLSARYFAGHGGIPGFLKSIAQEWPQVLIRSVDVDSEQLTPAEIGERLLGELSDPDGPVEIGYQGTRRLTWEPCAVTLDRSAAAPALLDRNSVVLITGGARGVTAAVALELARRYQPTLILVGRSAQPEAAEAANTASLTAAAEIKAALIAQLKQEGRPAVPAVIEAAYQRLLQDREIRGNLQRMKEAGARVHYHALNVRDTVSLARLLADIQQQFGRLDGVIHGAGVIEDRLLKDKTPESFDRVFGTKVESSLFLAQHLQPEKLKFCVFFASVASRFGNKGQSDYAAANEVLSKLAWQLDRTWPGRVLSIAWGPWAEIGMVAELEKHLVQRGLQLIAPDEGPRLLVDELLHGHKGESEVILAGGAQALTRPPRVRRETAATT